MRQGDRVRRRGNDVIGLVIGTDASGIVDVSFPDGISTVALDELIALEPDPAQRLRTGDVGSAERFRLRLHALFLKHAYRYDPVSALSSARIEPALHQVFVAHRVTSKLAPRMILSDEVGLGKTIEAGLILKELRARGLVERVLVCVPASLQLQWQRELESKFNERFEILDGAAAKHFGRDGKNPFKVHNNVICSHSLAIREPRTQQITDAPWDLVLFDEAHRVRRSEQGGRANVTKLYQLAEDLKEQTFGMLLLTATPMQLSPYELWSSIDLVEPGLYPSYASYCTVKDQLPALNEIMRCIQNWGALSAGDRQAFTASANAAELRKNTGLSPDLADLDTHEGRQRVRDAVVRAHPLTQVLVRNRKVSIGGFTRRIAHRIPVELTPEEQQAQQRVSDYLRFAYEAAMRTKNGPLGFLMVTYHKMLASSSHAIRGSLQRRLARLGQLRDAKRPEKAQQTPQNEDELRESDSLSDAVDELEDIVDPAGLEYEITELESLIAILSKLRDSKAQAFLSVLTKSERHEPGAKVLVFTQFIETQQFLRQVLEANGMSVAIFNGRMSADEKERAVEAFRESTQILVSTESGGEGRNFQFAHILVNYDLPWNPMRVEQRIGRLDRIGQKHDVLIYNLASIGTVEDRVLELLQDRIRLFEQSVGSLDPILGRVERDIERIVMTAHDLSAELKDYGAKDLSQRIAEAHEKEHTLADFVLDDASLRHDEAKELIDGVSPYARAEDLERLVADIVAHYGGVLTRTEEDEVAVTLSPGLASTVRSPERVSIGVFDPQDALRLEHRPFFSFGHRLVDALVALPGSDHPVTATIQRRRDTDRPYVELIYELLTDGLIKEGELVRHLVAEDSQVLTERLKALPPVGREAPDMDVPSWVSDAAAASRQAMYDDLNSRRAAIADKDAAVRAGKLEREKRVHDEAVRRLRARSDDLTTRIYDLDLTGSAGQRRIIPALQGQVDRTRTRLQERESGHEERLREIEAQESSSHFQLLSASFVMPL